MNGSDGIELIAEERQRQIEQEEWTAEHDDKLHCDGELSEAAACYCIGSDRVQPLRRMANSARGADEMCYEYDYYAPKLGEGELRWPWHDGYKPKDRISDLVRAGALIAAEIDRLQRAANNF